MTTAIQTVPALAASLTEAVQLLYEVQADIEGLYDAFDHDDQGAKTTASTAIARINQFLQAYPRAIAAAKE